MEGLEVGRKFVTQGMFVVGGFRIVKTSSPAKDLGILVFLGSTSDDMPMDVA